MEKPTIAITMGDPAGIGPEVTLRALSEKKVREKVRPLVVGDMAILSHLATLLNIDPLCEEEVISVSALKPSSVEPGRVSAECGRAMISYVEEAVRGCLEGRFHAMVTAPINKLAARLAGFGFQGHTEYIAHLTGTTDYAMMFVTDSLKVVLVTIHTPLGSVPELIKEEDVYRIIRLSDETLRLYFGIDAPSIAVCGLNPHAGEDGLFGREDQEIIKPAIERARTDGIEATGPYPADTLFWRAQKGEFDCCVAMYHDQGLIPVKLTSFDTAVNVTIGLPIIRTSVDHGTAYQLAWKGVADHRNMVSAIELAARMATLRFSHGQDSNKGCKGTQP